jgi:hypothetical protein
MEVPQKLKTDHVETELLILSSFPGEVDGCRCWTGVKSKTSTNFIKRIAKQPMKQDR